jgi:uncharacterized membrane protein YvbJ
VDYRKANTNKVKNNDNYAGDTGSEIATKQILVIAIFAVIFISVILLLVFR